ncbi:MAG: cobaltochelatase subunit CobT [Rhodospirillaceae bacterium]|nr:cobaltochelatase subunit CobT [Rhodospirillaceae bacterium]
MADNGSPLEQFKQATGAALRAIAERDDIEVAYSNEPPGLSGERARLPFPSRDLPADEVAHVRGEADAMALKLRHHDAAAHAKNRPGGEVAPMLYEALEEARCEALGARKMVGLGENLTAMHEDRYRRQGLHRVTDRTEATMPDAVRMMVREYLTGTPPPPAAEKVCELWKPWLKERIGQILGDLDDRIEDQVSYGETVRQLIQDLEIEISMETPEDGDPESGDEDQDESDSESDSDQDSDGASDENAEAMADAMEQAGGEEEFSDMMPEDGDDDMMPSPGSDEEGEPGTPWRPQNDLSNVPREPFYTAFTEQYDEVIPADELCDTEELNRLRQMLDQQLTNLQGMIGKLANRLQRRLMAKQMRSWEFDLEEGLLDTSRLDRVVTNPLYPLSFKIEHDMEFRDTVVTLLIDNSGSMRGRPITIAAMSADILARTLERCGVKVEILGFTTRAWKGGQSREKWIHDGKFANPGRLNDLRHIIYKAADAPWRRARKNLGLMLREGLLKENIDGEALMWAHDRLVGRPEQRRILMVISDGAPVDDSTLSVNPGNYLERHLRDVIEYIEQCSPVELAAIGIGHDVTRYYRRAVTIVDVDQLGGTMMDQLADLFDEGNSDVEIGRSKRVVAGRRR